MNTIEQIGLLTVILTLIVYVTVWLMDKRNVTKQEKNDNSENKDTLPIRLQAYERLVILTERISLNSLLTRLPAGELTVQQYQRVLADQIRQEFDYNLSQQIYVEPHVWQAVSNLKEQNVYIVNQVAQTLPPAAMASELSKRIVELLQQDPNVSLHPIVLDALNYEAKKLM